MKALAQTHNMFLLAVTGFNKPVEVERPFSWENVKPYLKSISNKSKSAKVMSLAWKLYRGEQQRQGSSKFNRERLSFYISCAQSEVKAELKDAVVMTSEEVQFIGSDSLTAPREAA